MIASDLPVISISGTGRIRRTMAQAINTLQISSAGYGGRHPQAPQLLALLAVCQTAVSALLPIAGILTFSPTAKTYRIAGGPAQAGPNLIRASGNDGDVVYSSGTPTVATISPASGAVTPLLAGATIITASVAAYGGFLASSKSYIATVTA